MREVILEIVLVLFLFCNTIGNFDRNAIETLITVRKATAGISYSFSRKNYIRSRGMAVFCKFMACSTSYFLCNMFMYPWNICM